MSAITKKFALLLALVVGVALWGGLAQRLKDEGKFEYEPNVACIKGSPYGKVLALAMQGSIDLYWHRGTTHDYAEALNEDHHHGDGGHHHDHGGHHHDHGDGGDHHAHEKEGQAATAEAELDEPFRERVKKKIRQMEASAYRRTDNKPISPAHQKYIQGITEDKLRMAYELDPSNYTNYGNLHLFITTNNFGREAADDTQAVRLARKTLEYCKKDQVDPASWVTAASAAYNIIYHIGDYYEEFTVPEAKASLAEFDYCVLRYNELLQKAVEEGRIVSEIRYNEMNERVRYMSKLRKAQGVYMKRVMTTKMVSNEPTTTK